MRFYRRTAYLLMCAALIFGAGASVSAVEVTLAGIRIDTAFTNVLKKFGNPTRVTVGPVGGGLTGGNQPGGPGGPFGSPFGSPFGGTSMSGMTGGPFGSAGSGTLPGITGLGAPSTFPGIPGLSSGQPGQPGQPGQNPNSIMETETTWTYDLPDGTTAQFIISDKGKIVQITVAGDKPYAGSKTTQGIKIGSSFKDVILKYGYPEGQKYVNRVYLRMSYAEKQRVIFTLLDRKVVGVTVAFKDTGKDTDE